MALTKPAGTWTCEDLFALPEDGKHYEIIEGVLHVLPSVGWVHASVVTKVITMLIPLVSALGGRLLTAPLDVFFQGADPVQPDILVILPGWQGKLATRGPEGAPDLLIEVVSPSHRVHDLLTKRALYGRAGVREYWIVDPAARTIEILALDRDAFHLSSAASGSETPVSSLFGPLPIAADDLFADADA